MDNIEETQKGIIASDYPDIELPCHSIWSYLYPHLQRYNNLKSFVSLTTNKSYTYKELIDSSLRFAKELEKYVEYNASEAVAVIMPNNIDFPVVDLGAFAVGASLCLIRHDFQPDIALDILKDVNPKVLVIDSSLLDKYKVMFPHLPKIKIFVRGSNEKYPEGEDLNAILSSTGEGLDVERAMNVDPETIAVVTCSSGTTGKPKPIVITHKILIHSVISFTYEPIYPVRRAVDGTQDTMLAYLPYAHIFSLVYYILAATSFGCLMLDIDTEDLSLLVDMVEKYKPRILTFRAYMVEALTKIKGVGEKLKSADVILNVGCPLNPDSAQLLKKMIGKNIFYSDVYGASEIMTIITSPLNMVYEEHLGSAGKIIPNVKVRLIDPSTNQPIIKPFTRGELLIKSHGAMKGYFNNPEATKEAFDGEWFRTGDICYFDNDYYFYVIERFKELITFRGKKILPSSIENIIKQHDAVIDVGVIGVPDSITREEVSRAFIRRNRPVSEEEIMDFVKKNTSQEELWLHGGVKFVETLPRNHMGKLLRKVLREMDWSG